MTHNLGEIAHPDSKSQTIHDKNTRIHQPRTKSLLFVEVLTIVRADEACEGLYGTLSDGAATRRVLLR